jgi:hypothetical protein
LPLRRPSRASLNACAELPVVVALGLGLQGPELLVRGRGAGLAEGVLRQLGEAGRVVDPVHQDLLLLGRGLADGQRQPERDQHAGHQGEQDSEQAGAHQSVAPGAGMTSR